MKLEYKFSSMTELLLHKFGEQYLFEVWKELGMYKSAEKISNELNIWVTGNVMRYLSHKFNWKRSITDKTLPIYKGILYGRQPRELYSHIIFG